MMDNTQGITDNAQFSTQYTEISVQTVHTYGSVSPGRGKWPFRVTFFLKVERSCGQTVKDRHDFSIVLCQLYLLDHQITSRRTSEIFFWYLLVPLEFTHF